MPDLIRHPVPFWIPVPRFRGDRLFARMTTVGYLTAGVILSKEGKHYGQVGNQNAKKDSSLPSVDAVLGKAKNNQQEH